MAERRGNRLKPEDDLPVYLARPGTADQVPRQKHGGLFCSVQDAFDSKTIDFDALSVGRRGSRTPRSDTQEERTSPVTASGIRSPAGLECPAEKRRGENWSPETETRTGRGKEVLQNLGDEKVRRLKLLRGCQQLVSTEMWRKKNSVFCLSCPAYCDPVMVYYVEIKF